MKKFLSYITICLLASFFGCTFQDHVNPDTQKAKVIEALTATDRYWRFEDMTKEVGGKTIHLLTETTPPPFYISLYFRSLGYQFDASSFNVIATEGPSGELPYGIDTLSVTFIGIQNNIKWTWDDAKQTVVLTGFTEGFRPLTGYLNTSMFPVYKNLGEAMAAGKPERIQIVMEENDPVLGLITYRYSLRAAWVTKSIAGNTLQKYFKVLY